MVLAFEINFLDTRECRCAALRSLATARSLRLLKNGSTVFTSASVIFSRHARLQDTGSLEDLAGRSMPNALAARADGLSVERLSSPKVKTDNRHGK